MDIPERVSAVLSTLVGRKRLREDFRKGLPTAFFDADDDPVNTGLTNRLS